ncbi:ROK family transcriptional regulator [Streptomyces sp. NPDC051976]|uniref:ROK family transcriptional regulator n=1 Tax=Streptomyces sp. NPDC051976 TaxID=3154947 RepID=UPI00342FED35
MPAQPSGRPPATLTGSEARAANHRAVLDLLRRGDAMTRAQLSRETGLSRSTISRLVAGLADRGLVSEDQVHHGAGAGRPATLLRLNRRVGVAVGVDAGVEHVGVLVGDLSRRVRVERWHHLPSDMGGGARQAVLLRAVRDAVAEAGINPGELVGAGVSVAAPVSSTSGEVTDPKVLPWWEEARVAEALTSHFGIPVVQDNDANLGALAELTWGARAGTRNMVYLKAASRIGAGIVIDGSVYRGPSGYAGEIGHSVVEPGGRLCWCGERGCLELYAGGAAILADLAARHRPLAGIADLAAAARAGDAQVAAVLGRAGRALGRALRTTAVLLSPREIVVGGELSALGDALLGPIRTELATIPGGRRVGVTVSSLGERASLWGALALVSAEATSFSREHRWRHPGIAAGAVSEEDGGEQNSLIMTTY